MYIPSEHTLHAYPNSKEGYIYTIGACAHICITHCFVTQVNAVFVNIFGGIVRCDEIARGIIAAAQEINITVPIVVRLQGAPPQLMYIVYTTSFVCNINEAIYNSIYGIVGFTELCVCYREQTEESQGHD